MSASYKIVSVLAFILIFGLGVTKTAEYYSQEGVTSNPMVKAASQKIDTFVKKATGGAFGPDAIGPYISMPGKEN